MVPLGGGFVSDVAKVMVVYAMSAHNVSAEDESRWSVREK